jgi:hypothetical protein
MEGNEEAGERKRDSEREESGTGEERRRTVEQTEHVFGICPVRTLFNTLIVLTEAFIDFTEPLQTNAVIVNSSSLPALPSTSLLIHELSYPSMLLITF